MTELETMQDILRDCRRIKAIWYEPDGEYQVDRSHVTEIVAYGEPGEFCHKPWFRIMHGDTIAFRINALFVAGVSYFEDK